MTALILKALIDEANCIGCRKCSLICPTDAIIGAAKKVHTVVPDLCTSCNKCVNTCPTGCIQLTTIGYKMSLQQERELIRSKKQRLLDHRRDHLVPKTIFTQNMSKTTKPLSTEERKRAVAAAVARVKARKFQRITCDIAGD